jgi:hypothetical protein
MGRLDRYKDVVEFVYPSVDPMQYFLGKKGFMEWLRGLKEEEVVEFAKQYVVWRDRRLRECALIKFEVENESTGAKEEEYRVYVPRLRALRRDYYLWVRDVELPKGYYRLITLTLGRWISIVDAWKNVNKWTSACLHRVRNALRRKFKVDLFYVWVVEAHKDGYPHVHVLVSVPKYVAGLTFEYFLKLLQESWVDYEGRCLCEPQGVDLKYVGTDVEKVKSYLLKYLVKEHGAIWGFEVEGMLVRARLSTLLIWAFKVRLFGFSQKLKVLIERVKKFVSSCFMGRVSAYRLWRYVYSMEEGFKEFLEGFLIRGRSKKIARELVPKLVVG